MCGIVGILGRHGGNRALLGQMADAVLHRGPDAEGVWTDNDASIGIAHRRLAIVDLSPAGDQPMLSADARLVLSFNGEIYNHKQLRDELDSARLAPEGGWRGHSDTETLLAAICAWGLRNALDRSFGMFAIALWDRSDRRLSLARDRFGEKPLYFGWAGGDFIFGSELSPIRCHPNFDAAIEHRAVEGLLTRNYIPAPFSVYRGIFKLPPGTIMTVDERVIGAAPADPPTTKPLDGISVEPYFRWLNEVHSGELDPIRVQADALALLDAALMEVMAEQAEADVPVGAFLSGGFDSSTICAYYQRVSPRPIRTYTIGFEDSDFNEAPYANAVAKHLGTEHHELYVTSKDALDIVPDLPGIYTEPFADVSQIPTYIVSRMARRDVTVALSGDGGDELFSGYTRHWESTRNWRRLSRLPRPIRKCLGTAIGSIPDVALELAARASPFSGSQLTRIGRLARTAQSAEDVFQSSLDPWWGQHLPLREPSSEHFGARPNPIVNDSARFAGEDAVSYLPDDILVKVDRASMAVSLEARAPFLDVRVARVAAAIDSSLKIRGAEGKWILKQLLYRLVPPRLVNRPKRGFALPTGSWLRGPLREWANELLDPRELASDGLFDPSVVLNVWQTHLKGRRDHSVALWSILMFRSWQSYNRPSGMGVR